MFRSLGYRLCSGAVLGVTIVIRKHVLKILKEYTVSICKKINIKLLNLKKITA